MVSKKILLESIEKLQEEEKKIVSQLKKADQKIDRLRDGSRILKHNLLDLREEYRQHNDSEKNTISSLQEKFQELEQQLENLQTINKKQMAYADIKFDAIREAISKVDAKVNAIQESRSKNDVKTDAIREVLSKNDTKVDALRDAIRNINKKIDRLEKNILYTNDTERNKIQSFYDLYDSSDFQKKFIQLISGLEKSDVLEIVKIISRQKMIRNENKAGYDLFCQSEKEMLYEMKQYMASHIIEINENLFCYENYFMPINHFEPSVFYYKHGIELISDSSVLEGKDILDVGGFYGDSVLVLNELSCRAIYSFESIEHNYSILKRTLELNGITNCIPQKIALGDIDGTIQMADMGSASSLVQNAHGESEKIENVNVMRLDSWIEQQNETVDIGLIKVDIEGAEQMFLQGARKTIEKFKPIMLLSIYHNASDFFDIKPLIESWNLGYKFKIYKPCDDTISREVLLICEVR